jgi:putative heme-binding domain-containing protein
MEVRVAFRGELDPAVAGAMAGQSIGFGEGERAGRLRIAAARLDDGGRTLVLATDPHPWEATYRLAVPGFRLKGMPGPAATVHFSYGLNGVEAAWDDGKDESKAAWSGWWPQLDTEALRKLATISAEHERVLGLLTRPGRLRLRTLAKLPKGKVTVHLDGSLPFEALALGQSAQSREGDRKGLHRADLPVESTGEATDLEVTLTTGTGGQAASLRASYDLPGSPGSRPLPREMLLVPWAPAPPSGTPAAASPPFTLAGGDPKRGEAVFFSDEAKCSSCHKVRGKGGDVGPDLANQAGRDRELVYRDVADPSAVINPEYVPYTVALKDGQVAVGVVRAEGADAIRVSDTNAKSVVVKKSEIEDLRPSGTSIMPVGLTGALGEQKVRDLIAFLVAGRKD